MKRELLFPELVESITVHPDYDTISLESPITVRDRTGFFMDREYGSIRIKKAYIKLNPEFSKLPIELYSVKELSFEEKKAFYLNYNYDTCINSFVPALEPIIVFKQHKKYESMEAADTVFFRTDSRTLAKLKLKFY